MLRVGKWVSWRFRRAQESAADQPIDDGETDRRHGTLTVQGNTLYYSRSGSPVWPVVPDECSLIAERTTATGPYCDDWFVLLFSGVPPELHEAPLYANTGVHRILSQALGVEVRPQLTHSTERQTAIAWPRELEGEPFLRHVPAARGHGLIARLKDRLAPLAHAQLTDEARRIIDPAGDCDR